MTGEDGTRVALHCKWTELKFIKNFFSFHYFDGKTIHQSSSILQHRCCKNPLKLLRALRNYVTKSSRSNEYAIRFSWHVVIFHRNYALLIRAVRLSAAFSVPYRTQMRIYICACRPFRFVVYRCTVCRESLHGNAVASSEFLFWLYAFYFYSCSRCCCRCLLIFIQYSWPGPPEMPESCRHNVK